MMIAGFETWPATAEHLLFPEVLSRLAKCNQVQCTKKASPDDQQPGTQVVKLVVRMIAEQDVEKHMDNGEAGQAQCSC